MLKYKPDNIVEQSTKADRLRMSRHLREANPAPRYGGLVPPFYVRSLVQIKTKSTMLKSAQSISLIAIVFFALIGCEKNKSTPEYIPEGYYSGHFIYAGDTIFDAFIFNAGTFSEVPSGGVMHQKYPCVVEGTYAIQDGKIDFTILKYPEEGSNCSTDVLLTGSYDLKLSGDSLEFTKGEGGNKQQYKMKKVSESR